MRVFREEDPTHGGYTVVENDTLWVDLSCRALGLLVRWLSKPPGVEVDTIQDIVTRSRRRGNKRMEGRDALYTASYELEAEGYLVRRLFTNEKGQHEWAAFVRSRPVPPEERSSPEDRKRPTTKTKPAKKAAPKKPAAPSQGRPKPENPFSGSTRDDAASSQVGPVTEKPDSGEPDSENQASSYQSSLHSSLSPQPGDQPQEDAPEAAETRETATPEDTPTAASAEGIPQQRQEITDMVLSLPGIQATADALDLEPLVLDALAEGWTLPRLRSHLARKCDPSRVFDPCAVYRKHLKRLPEPTSAGASGAPREDCQDCQGTGLREDPVTFLPAGKCACRTAPAPA
jgi:hypothetical protein